MELKLPYTYKSQVVRGKYSHTILVSLNGIKLSTQKADGHYYTYDPMTKQYLQILYSKATFTIENIGKHLTMISIGEGKDLLKIPNKYGKPICLVRGIKMY
ncbi:hypothetical protein [Nonlabens xiamenensis]|uniref:hypothetical protein n=1 Tax=Nonlabens xiamenensis TaxID=2341043 RepID=UPI000F60D10D|nr:hypothetical protein [Nonlabens xiamenensis]